MEFALKTLALSFLINLSMFFVAYILKTDILTDISYALSFIALALYSYLMNEINIPNTLVITMVIIWACRLGIFLFLRILRMKKDKRFDNIRSNFIKFLSFWILQGASVWIISFPSQVFYYKSFPNSSIGILNIFGISIWALGLMLESLADYQKQKFNSDPKNKGKWIDVGLWSFIRHPNYFGEILLWVGVYLFTFQDIPSKYKLISLTSPAYIFILIVFISGVPILEKKANEKWGSDPNYMLYKKRTFILFPFLY